MKFDSIPSVLTYIYNDYRIDMSFFERQGTTLNSLIVRTTNWLSEVIGSKGLFCFNDPIWIVFRTIHNMLL